MKLIIDGYNVLKQRHSNESVTEQQRKSFLSELVRYKKQKKHKIMVVFDGGDSPWPYREDFSGIEIVYSGTQKDADHFIKNYVSYYRKELLMVSSDNELSLWASENQVASIGATDFYAILQRSLHTQAKLPKNKHTQLIKTADTENVELDMLMQEATVSTPLKREDAQEAQEMKVVQKKLRKHDRALERKLNKL
jgi:predicted RNA-binding protein with PIN domain